MAKQRKPNLFILGAPKCGTTSVYQWLSEHPNVFMSPMKEPHFFNTDENQRWVTSLEEYEGLFAGATDRHRTIGEASTWYMHSDEAVPNILQYASAPKFVVCLRNPVDMAYSLHAQYLNKTHRENIGSFERAWALSDARRKGQCVGSRVTDPRYLAYKYSCAIGTQLECVLQRVPKDSVHVVVLDDLKSNPTREYTDLLRFLGLPYEGRQKFPTYNQRVEYRSIRLHRAMMGLSQMKCTIGLRRGRLGLMPKAVRFNRIRATREMPIGIRKLLTEYFRNEIELIFQLLEKEYPHWLQDG